jgi:type I restriction enzyme M protein
MPSRPSARGSYVLVLLFVKYISDKYAGQKDALIDVPAGGIG